MEGAGVNCTHYIKFYIETCLVCTVLYIERDTKSVLIIRGTCYQGWFMYMRYTQGQNKEHLSRYLQSGF